jgi:hypothetical protein
MLPFLIGMATLLCCTARRLQIWSLAHPSTVHYWRPDDRSEFKGTSAEPWDHAFHRSTVLYNACRPTSPPLLLRNINKIHHGSYRKNRAAAANQIPSVSINPFHRSKVPSLSKLSTRLNKRNTYIAEAFIFEQWELETHRPLMRTRTCSPCIRH